MLKQVSGMFQEVLQRVASFCGSAGERPRCEWTVAQCLAKYYVEPRGILDEDASSAAYRPRLNSVLATILVEFAVPRDEVVVLSRSGMSVLSCQATGLRHVRDVPPPSSDCSGIAAAGGSSVCIGCGLGVTILNHNYVPQKAFLTAHSHTVLCVAATEDGQHLATGGSDAAVVFWSAMEGPLSFLSAHNDWVRFIRFARGPVGKLLLFSAGDDGLIVLWDPMLGIEIARLEYSQGSAIRAMDISQRLLVAASDAPFGRGSFGLFTFDSLAIYDNGVLREVHTASPTTCTITPDEQWLVSAAEDEILSVTSLSLRQVMWSCTAFVSKRRCLSFMTTICAVRILACPPISSVIVVLACASDGEVLQWIVDPRRDVGQPSFLTKRALKIGPLVDMDIVGVRHVTQLPSLLLRGRFF